MPVETDTWDRMWELFHEALEQSPEQREAFLAEACGDAPELRREIEELLAAHEHPVVSVEPPAAPGDAAPTATNATEGPSAPTHIGRYEIRRVIASGGMGTVYEAVQDHPHRVVALKVMRHEAASRQAMKRFQHESEILGRLRHPNIAQIYDAGTFDKGEGAQPYFAMEYVRGRPLLQHCDAKTVGTRERLQLSAKVCDAVQYAHHHGVIHRDLKPDNILVDDFGEPKILDFGVARATGSDMQVTTLRTDVGQLIGTVPYMSPEQVTGDPNELDTRSDVYSLGVVVYELLCGRLPYQLLEKNIPDAVRVIREEDPTPLSSVNRVFRGDLETIVAKALEKEKDRRYQTVSELAADIRHYLADEPIVARPASTVYHLRKFARRNTALVAGVAVALAALIAGASIATWQAIHARGETAKAVIIKEYLERALGATDIFAAGGALTPVQMLDRAVTEVDAVSGEPEIEAEIRYILGLSYSNMSQLAKALEQLHLAYEIRRRTFGVEHPDTLKTATALARMLSHNARLDEADALLVQVLETQRRILGDEHQDTLWSLFQLGATRTNSSNREAEGLLRTATEGLDRVLGPDHYRTLRSMMSLGESISYNGNRSEGIAVLRSMTDRARVVLGDTHWLTLWGTFRMGLFLDYDGHWDEGEPLMRSSAKALLSHYGENYLALDAMEYLGSRLHRHGNTEEGAPLLREGVEKLRRVVGTRHHLVAQAIGRLATLERDLGNLEEAASLLREQADIVLEVQGEHWSLWPRKRLARVLRDQKKLVEAETVFREVLAGYRRINRPRDRSTLRTMRDLAWFLKDRGADKLAEAEALLREAIESYTPIFGEHDADTLQCMNNLGVILGRTGRHAEAKMCFRDAIDRSQRGTGAESRQTLTAMNQLAWFLKDAEEPQELLEAEDLAREATSLVRSTYGEDDNLTIMIADTLAVLLHLRGNNEDAIVEFEAVAAAARRAAGDRWLTEFSALQYGQCLTALGRYADAEAVLLAIQDRGDDAAAEARIDLYDAWGKPEKAAEYRNLLREAKPTDPS